MNVDINFVRYIDGITVFIRDNLQNIFLSNHPKEFVLKNINCINFTPFLDLKVNFISND